MGRLTTHILDTANGVPAEGVDIRVYGCDDTRTLLASATTTTSGRTELPLLEGGAFASQVYEIEFDIGDYFRKQATSGAKAFLDTVVIRVTLDGDEHYHVPLLASPWSYSTYRGS